ncbi:MAG: zinc ribbon domain-containing protein [Chloroflexi bacterium]|nr:zinc ribbon domain-containing protein [Chloroflexota bacterium]
MPPREVLAMPVYDYRCRVCGHEFSRFWRTIQRAQEAPTPECPLCGQGLTERVVSQVTLLGDLGGLTPNERAAKRAQEEKQAAITPREQIRKFQSAKKK